MLLQKYVFNHSKVRRKIFIKIIKIDGQYNVWLLNIAVLNHDINKSINALKLKKNLL